MSHNTSSGWQRKSVLNSTIIKLGFAVAGNVMAAALTVAAGAAPINADVEADNDVNFDNGRGPGRWAQPQVEFEIRLAADAAIPADSRMLRVSLDSDKGSIDADLERAVGKDAQGGALLRGTVSITHRAINRLIVIYVPGQPDRLCESALAADPPTTGSLGAWRACTMVFDAEASSPRAPRAVEAAHLRYKVWRPPVWRDAIH